MTRPFKIHHPSRATHNYKFATAATIRRFATAHPEFVQDVAAKAVYCAYAFVQKSNIYQTVDTAKGLPCTRLALHQEICIKHHRRCRWMKLLHSRFSMVPMETVPVICGEHCPGKAATGKLYSTPHTPKGRVRSVTYHQPGVLDVVPRLPTPRDSVPLLRGCHNDSRSPAQKAHTHT